MTRRLASALAAPAMRALRAFDRTAGRMTRTRKVLVEARTPMNLAVLRPILNGLLDDDRLQLRFTGVERDDLRAAFAEMGVSDRAITRERAMWTRFDLYLNADPWDALPLRRTARQVNFFHGVAGKYDLDCPSNLPLEFHRYDRVAFPNEGRLRRYVDAGIVANDRAALIGYPKADALASSAARPADLAAALGLDPGRATIIYAPTFSTASSLHTSGEAIVGSLLGAGWNVIVKLHDRSFDPDPKYTGGVDWRARLARFAETGRFVLAASGDSTPYVLASDLLVTDHSSIGFEFYVADRPVVVFDAPDLSRAARINPDKVALLRSAAVVASSVDELVAAVRAELDAPHRRSAERRRVANEVFDRPGGATGRALRMIYELLGLPSPATLRQALPVAGPADAASARSGTA